MKPENEPRWEAVTHLHVADAEPRGDAAENTPAKTVPVLHRLFRRGEINVAAAVAHDAFPQQQKSLDAFRKNLVNPFFVGNEISASVPDTMRDTVRKFTARLVHLLGYFPEPPKSWPLSQQLTWPKRLRDKISFIADVLPTLDEALAVILDHGGVAVVAHPSPFPILWGSLRLDEISRLLSKRYLRDVALELNGHPLYRQTNSRVENFAREQGLAVVGGSDAHRPREIGRLKTIFPRLTDDVFSDFKSAVSKRTTRVERGKRTTLFSRKK